MPDIDSHEAVVSPTTPSDSTAPRNKRAQCLAGVILVLALLAASLLLRLTNLNATLVEVNPFRQTQTAFTVWEFQQSGIDLLHPKLPVLGPPWQAPFEFPLFQASAAVVAKVFPIQLDAACRLTNVVYFYLSALFLFLLCRALAPLGVAVAAMLVYAFMPFTIVWSRTSMIEYAAVAFALAYIYFVIIWLKQPRRLWPLGACVGAGVLGALTKITTMAIAAPAVAIFALFYLRNRRHQTASSMPPRSGWQISSALAAIILIPLLAALLWIEHADHIKSQSPLTAWLTSDNLRAWNYGTLHQRLDKTIWKELGDRVQSWILPDAVLLLPLLAFAGLRKWSSETRFLLISMAIATVLPILFFFNLYSVHDYYLCAITPCIAVVAGIGAYWLWQRAPIYRWLGALLVVAIAINGLLDGRRWMVHRFASGADHESCIVGAAVAQATLSDSYVVIADFDWDPAILYYAKRRGVMLRDPDAHLPDYLTDGRFTTLVYRHEHPRLLALWKHKQVLRHVGGFAVMSVRP